MVQPKGSRGSVLLIALIVVILIGGLSAAFVSMSYSQSKTTYGSTERESSLNMAEAGVDDAINKLNALMTAAWKGDDLLTKAALTAVPTSGSYVIYAPVTSGDFYCVNTGTVTGGVSSTTYSGKVNRGTFDVTITPAFIGNGSYTITAHGIHGKEKKGLSVLVNPAAGNSIGDYGLVGKVTLTATSSNVFVDSYKSTAGSYSSQATNTYPATGQAYARDKGNLGSNGDIDVKNGIVFGSATPGPTSTVTVGSATITGATTPATAALDIPSQPFTAPTMPSSPTAMTPKTWGNGNVTLTGSGSSQSGGTPGTYYYSTAVGQGSGAGLTITGNVILYVDGDIGFNANEALTYTTLDSSLTIYQKSGNITMNGQTYPSSLGAPNPTASSLQIYSATTGDVKFNGGSTVYASVYAPDAAFRQTGTSTFYGRMVASTIDIGGNMTFHRDEDAVVSASAPPVFRIKAINETNF